MKFVTEAPVFDPGSFDQSVLSDPILSARIRGFNDRYLHWTEVRYRTADETEFNAVWSAMKFIRGLTSQRLTICDKEFSYCMTPRFTELLHYIDRDAAGRIETRLSGERETKRYLANSLMEEAIASGNMEGWKANEVTEFTSSEGEDPKNDYTDNVIFPSGTSDPLTISDWEWMLDAFKKALDDKGFSGNTDAYCTTVYYPGFFGMGDLVSSFGGGTGVWSKDADQNVYFGGTTDAFRTYLECMNTWNNNGWLDTRFETRASDIFFSINQTGTAQGQVGMWYGTLASLGTAIRVTCADATDQQNAYVMGCAVPINDTYGTADQMYNEPDAFYQGSRIAGRIGITTAAEDKDIAALLTCLDWFYTPEGAAVRSFGLSQEQIDSADIENNLYEEYNIEGGAYTMTEGEDGKTLYTLNYDNSSDITNALKTTRMVVGMEYTGAGADIDYTLDTGEGKVVADAKTQWTRYTSTASVSDYNGQFDDDQNQTYSDMSQTASDYMAQNIPNMIKNGLDGWDSYVEGLENLGIDDMTEIYQSIVDELFAQ